MVTVFWWYKALSQQKIFVSMHKSTKTVDILSKYRKMPSLGLTNALARAGGYACHGQAGYGHDHHGYQGYGGHTKADYREYYKPSYLG